jgi:hypothetical protein
VAHHPEEEAENKLKEELELFCRREAVVRHTSQAPRSLETERTGSVASKRDEILDGFRAGS